MKTVCDRRDLLKAAIGGAVGLSLPLPAFAQGAAALKAQEIGDGLIMVSGAGGNVVAAKAGDGVLLVDGGLKDRSDDLLNLVAKQLGSDNFHTLFNTHWHPEQTGSNERLGKAGAAIIAHANTRLWLSTEIAPPYEDRTYQPLPPKARPTEIFYVGAQEKTIGGRAVEYGYVLQAHTDGDIYVRFPQDNVLVAGGPVSNDGWPYMDWWTGGWIGGLADGVAKLAQIADDETTVVPANGPLMRHADLEEQQAMYADIFQKLRESLYSALSPAEAVAKEPAKPYVDKMGDPNRFLTLASQSMWGHFTPDA